MNFNDYAMELKSRAQNTQWFSRVGTSDLGADVLRIDCWNTAILQMSEDEFGLARNAASNATRRKFIAEYCDGDARKFDGKKWNKCAGDCEDLAEKISKPLAKHAKTNTIPSEVVTNFKSAVLQDLLSLGMTGKGSEEFFGPIINFYLTGFCPCGYVGNYPHGKLVVY